MIKTLSFVHEKGLLESSPATFATVILSPSFGRVGCHVFIR
jgi:hypothetical protein